MAVGFVNLADGDELFLQSRSGNGCRSRERTEVVAEARLDVVVASFAHDAHKVLGIVGSIAAGSSISITFAASSILSATLLVSFAAFVSILSNFLASFRVFS